jgi:uncharacterized protein YerC
MKSSLSMMKVLAKILSRRSAPQVFELLENILTEKEKEFVENRLRIAFLLRQGASYTKIQDELKVSAATVAVVAEQLKQEKFSLLVDQVEKEMTRFAWLKKRLHG